MNKRPTIHLSGIPRDAMETTFNGGRPFTGMAISSPICNDFLDYPNEL